MANEKIILGIDPGTTIMGFGLIKVVGKKMEFLQLNELQLKKYDLLAISNNLTMYGIKKIRRIGHTMEFEQIKEYVQGDDLRTINWKATAKQNQLMVNQYQDEKSQPVYSVIEKGRVMKMPFNGLSLLDYAINATLVMSNVILKKQDKAGMFTFSKQVENMVVAEKRSAQMSMILESLYNVNTDFYMISSYTRKVACSILTPLFYLYIFS